jgi:hypothetical protein
MSPPGTGAALIIGECGGIMEEEVADAMRTGTFAHTLAAFQGNAATGGAAPGAHDASASDAKSSP